MDDEETAWRDRLAAARRAVAALEGFGRRTDRIRAVATELLTRAERLEPGEPATCRASRLTIDLTHELFAISLATVGSCADNDL